MLIFNECPDKCPINDLNYLFLINWIVSFSQNMKIFHLVFWKHLKFDWNNWIWEKKSCSKSKEVSIFLSFQLKFEFVWNSKLSENIEMNLFSWWFWKDSEISSLFKDHLKRDEITRITPAKKSGSKVGAGAGSLHAQETKCLSPSNCGSSKSCQVKGWESHSQSSVDWQSEKVIDSVGVPAWD